MKYFHPIAMLLFFAGVTIPLMILRNPLYTGVSLTFAIVLLGQVKGRKRLITEVSAVFVLAVIMTVINPLFVHRGSTPLLFVNGRAVTLESLFFGANSSLALAAVILWFSSFSTIMTSDRVLCIVGKLSPRTAAMLSMTLRFIPDMMKQWKKITVYAQISGENNAPLKRILSRFSALVTWSIENAVQTADSMKARGFDLGGRTSCTPFRFRTEDCILSILSVSACVSAAVFSGKVSVSNYPVIEFPPLSVGFSAVLCLTTAACGSALGFSLLTDFKRKRSQKEHKVKYENY